MFAKLDNHTAIKKNPGKSWIYKTPDIWVYCPKK